MTKRNEIADTDLDEMVAEERELQRKMLIETFEQMVHATREFLATSVAPNEDEALTNLRRGLQAALDEYDAAED